MNRRAVIQRGVVLAVLLALALPVTAGQVVVFDKYDTEATISGDTIHVERDVRIKNIGETPIIPGELHFRLFERRGDDKQPLEIQNFKATSDRGEKLGTKVTTRQDETDMSVSLWNPLLPGFHYDFTLEYDLAFEPSGILFYEIKLPQEETTIPITRESTRFVLEDGYHVTYAPEGSVDTISGNAVVEWSDADEERVVEYSRLPLPQTGLRAVNVFWLVIIVALIGVFVYSLRRRKKPPKRGGKRQSGPQQQPPQWQQQQQYGGPPNYGGGRG